MTPTAPSSFSNPIEREIFVMYHVYLHALEKKKPLVEVDIIRKAIKLLKAELSVRRGTYRENMPPITDWKL